MGHEFDERLCAAASGSTLKGFKKTLPIRSRGLMPRVRSNSIIIFGILSTFLAECVAWAGGRRSSDMKFGVEMGTRMMFHYNQLRVISTPPESTLGEIQLQAWYKNRLIVYVSYAQSISMATSR